MKALLQIKKQLQKKWRSHYFHKAALMQQDVFPFEVRLPKITDKQMLHQFSEVTKWIVIMDKFAQKNSANLTILVQEVNFRSLGKQKIPVVISFANIKALSLYLGVYKQWQIFMQQAQTTLNTFVKLTPFLQTKPAELTVRLDIWPKLLSVCHYFMQNPRPNCYIREIAIEGIDSKFIESQRAILTKLFDILLPESAINEQIKGLSDYGFERRFYLKYEQPRVRFRVLDKKLASVFSGVLDIEITVEAFKLLTLHCDKVFITENKTNGLAFPDIKGAIVIFGLGYGIRSLKNVDWLNRCQLYYWGDIDTHGFAILAQFRQYFPQVKSFLMDENTLLVSKAFWGEEPEGKAHQAVQFNILDEKEQQLYQQLKSDHFQIRLRLEQEFIPFSYWLDELTQ